jgi:hypothetical protein
LVYQLLHRGDENTVPSALLHKSAWIRGRIAWLELLDALKVTCIGDDGCKFLQLLELIQLGRGLLIDRCCCHIFFLLYFREACAFRDLTKKYASTAEHTKPSWPLEKELAGRKGLA